jgi:hypothetical protein
MVRTRRRSLGVLGSLLLALATAPGPAAAQGRSAALYPLDGGSAAAGVEDAQAMVEVALTRAARRGMFSLASPTVVPASCGPAARATPACLGKLAGAGVLVMGTVRQSPGILVVSLSLLDARGIRHGPVGVGLDPFLQNPEAIVRAFAELERRAGEAALAAPPPSPAAPAARPEPVRSAPPAGPKRAWMRPAGKWATLGGVVLLGGAGVVAKSNARRADELRDRYSSAALTYEDRSKYRTVDTYNALTTGLFVAGGVATVAGVTLWGMAPDAVPTRGGMRFGVSGRF